MAVTVCVTGERGLPATADLLTWIEARLPEWSENAAHLDAQAEAPLAELQELRDIGAFLAPLPVALGGSGLGTEPAGAAGLSSLLRLVGRANLSLGRIFEGHVNALKLICLYGDEKQIQSAASDARDGHLFAIWTAEAKEPVRLEGARPSQILRGRKVFCSAAGIATRAVITATSDSGVAMMALVALRPEERAQTGVVETHGMRACKTGNVDFTGIELRAADVIGQDGDYLRQPAFSAGAWRASAVALGGLDSLIAHACQQLDARRRLSDGHQLARLGQTFIAGETAALWVEKSACVAESNDFGVQDIAGYVNLARLAVEGACLDAIRLVQRSLGLAAFVRPNPIERIVRDLATYLRQPAPDEALTEAAAWFAGNALPDIWRRGA